MYSEATGIVPKLPPDYAKTLVNRAWRDVRRKSLWSFLLFESNWTSPNVVNAGSVTTVQGQNTITFNVAATASINAIGTFPSPAAGRQFRIGVGTIYTIWNWVPGTGVATLDRPYQESSATGASYSIYQCYYPAPMQDFWQWLSVRDMVNYNDLITTKSRAWIDEHDPQRMIFYIPTHVVPYQIDQNPASATAGWQTFELWGQPQYQLTYQLYGLRKGTDLVNPTDTLPPQIGEDCVMALTRAYAYEWAEANKVDSREMGSDFRFLIGDAKADFKRLYQEYRLQDRAAVDNFATKLKRGWSWPNMDGWYSGIGGVASPGAAW